MLKPLIYTAFPSDQHLVDLKIFSNHRFESCV